MKATQTLYNLGQSLWLGDITRGLLNNGTLKRYIAELSVIGLTSNPTIFDHTIEADGSDEDVPLDAVAVGDRLRVRAGETVPVDGIVLEGASSLDEWMVTGEPIRVEKHAGEHVVGSTMNGAGTLVVAGKGRKSSTSATYHPAQQDHWSFLPEDQATQETANYESTQTVV